MKDHPCKGCQYAYFADVEVDHIFYNALADGYQTVGRCERLPYCGYSPSGVPVEDDRTHCAVYEKKEEEEGMEIVLDYKELAKEIAKLDLTELENEEV